MFLSFTQMKKIMQQLISGSSLGIALSTFDLKMREALFVDDMV